ncbi:gliding motility-associated C-terminal domain-containing protein [Ferruginibacter albus]|uniref:gliding motility-associated C-terminal domain-containing protein n=1 Tax=Ferruginibacter albus TaxID=2875540 RepID=UPI001CC3DAF1|nr:gliding motility-associated C-terminal domain-containing protein [Ferruginibacter albus]UAY52290.1 gliding motility-associated C-terminal domain-containing protein [Ferruginibacter albus]
MFLRFKKILLIIVECIGIFLLSQSSVKAQNILYFQGFEGICDNWSTSGAVQVTAGTQRTGSHSGRVGNQNSTLTLASANVTGYSGLLLNIYHSVNAGQGPGMDTREGALIQISLNGGAFTTIGRVSGYNDAHWAFGATGAPNGGPSAGCSVYTMPNPVTYNIPNGTTSVQVKVVTVRAGSCSAFNTAMNNATPSSFDRADEGIYIDDVQITTTTPLPPVLVLTSPEPSDTQHIISCTNTAIDNITYSVSAGGGTVTGLPPGVTYANNNGVLTISGSPTADGNYNYTVKDVCSGETLTGLITKLTPTSTSVDSENVCTAGLPYTWNGTAYSLAGSYVYHTTNAAGCDSAVTLVLSVTNDVTKNIPVSVCENLLPYVWNGNSYTTAGSYDYHTTNAAGCDSTATLQLTILKSTASPTPVSICENLLPYVWNGNSYATDGSYDYHTTNAAGCDSTATLVLTVLKASSSFTPVSVCEASLPYSWNSTLYDSSGSYDYHTINAAGCDSSATLVLTVLKATNSSTPVSVCASTLPYQWNGNSYTTDGSYDYHTTNAAGCDSTATLVLTILPTPVTSINPISVCENLLPYVWNGNSYVTAGSYDYHTTNATGCDSTATLVLTILKISGSTNPVSVCESALPYVWNGSSYTTAGSYDYHTTNAVGCDSAATLVLTVLKMSSSTNPVSVCENLLPYTWNGSSYNNSGSYDFHAMNAAGCDSTATLVLTVLKTTSSTTSVSVCAGLLPYAWNGNSYSTAGSYDYHTTNVAGCDSTATLVLTILQAPTNSINPISVCENLLPYVWNGKSYNLPGSYDYHTTNAAGCDSTATLVLTILKTSKSVTPVSVCASTLPYQWNGNSYNTAGSYDYHTTNAASCDSTATLILSVLKETSSSTAVKICSSALPYTWNGNAYNAAGSYDYHATNAVGCDSTATLILTVYKPATSIITIKICPTDLPYIWNGNSYTTDGSYDYHTIGTGGCDSIATLVLTILKATNSVTTINVCNTNLPFAWNGQAYTQSGTYVMHVPNVAGCDSLVTLQLTVIDNDFNVELSASDNDVLPGAAISLNTSGTSDYHILSWKPKQDFLSQTSLNQNLIAKKTTDIIVTAMSQLGCLDTVSLRLVVKDVNDFFVPNAFSPNNDGSNDFFSVYGSSVSSGRMSVYNQWGQLMFETADIKKGWDGTYKGKQQPAGVYNYIVTAVMYNGAAINTKGTINLIR